MKVYELDGRAFDTLEGFADEFSRVVLVDHAWRGNLDAFDDILGGGFGTPEDGFLLRWNDHEVSRERLGYVETVRQLEKRLEECPSVHRDTVRVELESAHSKNGPTVFDWLVEILRDHGPTGRHPEDKVSLDLA